MVRRVWSDVGENGSRCGDSEPSGTADTSLFERRKSWGGGGLVLDGRQRYAVHITGCFLCSFWGCSYKYLWCFRARKTISRHISFIEASSCYLKKHACHKVIDYNNGIRKCRIVDTARPIVAKQVWCSIPCLLFPVSVTYSPMIGSFCICSKRVSYLEHAVTSEIHRFHTRTTRKKSLFASP